MTLSVGPPVNRDTSRSWLTLDLKVGLIPGVIWLASLQPHFFLRYFKGSLLKARVLIEEQGSEQGCLICSGKVGHSSIGSHSLLEHPKKVLPDRKGSWGYSTGGQEQVG